MMAVPIFLVSLLFLLKVQFSTSISNQVFLGAHMKDNGNESPSFNFQNNLKNLLDTFTIQSSETNFNHSTFGEAPDQVHGLYLCRGDIDHIGCTNCINHVKDAILTVTNNNKWRCDMEWRSYKEAVIWYDHCMVHYSNKSFIGEVDESMELGGVCVDQYSETWNGIRFAEVLGDTLHQLVAEVTNDVSGRKFASKVVSITRLDSLYAMGQCTWDLTDENCKKCLTLATKKLLLKNYYRGSVGMALYPSCMVRYDTFPLFNNNTISSPSSSFSSLAMANLSTTSLNGPHPKDAEVM